MTDTLPVISPSAERTDGVTAPAVQHAEAHREPSLNLGRITKPPHTEHITRKAAQPRHDLTKRLDRLIGQLEEAETLSAARRHKVLDTLLPEAIDLLKACAGVLLIAKMEREAA